MYVYIYIYIFKGLTPSCRRPLAESPLGRSWRLVGRLLEDVFGGLGEPPGGVLAHLGASWRRLGACWGLLGLLGSVLEASWRAPGGILGPPGSLLGSFGGPRGLLEAVLEAHLDAPQASGTLSERSWNLAGSI